MSETMNWVELGATFFGAVFGIRMEAKRQRSRRLLEVDRIASFIYFELLDNYLELKNTIDKRSFFSFDTTFWDIYKEELRGWNPKNVIYLTNIYDTLKLLQKSLDSFQSYDEENEFVTGANVGDLEKKRRERHELFDIGFRQQLIFLGNQMINMLEWYEGNSSLMEQVKMAEKEFDSIYALSKEEELKDYQVKVTTYLF